MQAHSSVALTPEQLVSRVMGESWDLFKQHGVTLVLAWLLTALVSALTLGLASGTLAVGFILLVRSMRRGDPVGVGDVMHFGHFIVGLIATLLLGLGVTLGLCLLVVPGVLLAVMWTFTFQAMAYEDLGAVASMKASWALAKQSFLHVVVLVIVFTLINAVAGAVMFATLVSVPFTLVAMTVSWEVLSGTPPRTGLPALGDGTAEPGQDRAIG